MSRPWHIVLCVFVAALRISGQVLPEHCPDGSLRHGNSCYVIGHLLANWPEAMVYCEAYMGRLVYIESEGEQRFIFNMLQSSAVAADHSKYFWLGGTDAISEGDWIWAKSPYKVQYTNWSPGEPNNDQGHDDHHQDCMAIYTDTGLWDDGYCETKQYFICEIE